MPERLMGGESSPRSVRRTDHPSKFSWPEWAVAKLGQVYDPSLANELGIHYSTVAAERLRRGIPPLKRRIEWTDAMLSLLGTATDREIGRRLGISESSVCKKRQEIEIDSHQVVGIPRRSRSDPFWTPEREALLGTDSDQKIADRLGTRLDKVGRHRRKLGIAAAYPIPRHDWSRFDDRLGTMPDARLAEELGMDMETVRRRRLKLRISPFQEAHGTIVRDDVVRELAAGPTREMEPAISSSAGVMIRRELGLPDPPRKSIWTAEYLARLGHEPDEAIANEIGLAVATVAWKRRGLGRQLRPFRRWSPEELAQVGRLPDRELAGKLGRSPKSVRSMRNKLGLPPVARGIARPE